MYSSRLITIISKEIRPQNAGSLIQRKHCQFSAIRLVYRDSAILDENAVENGIESTTS